MTTLNERVGCSDLPDTLRFIAERGAATYGMDLVCEALNDAAEAIEVLVDELALAYRLIVALKKQRDA